jgi:hypothetical protein
VQCYAMMCCAHCAVLCDAFLSLSLHFAVLSVLCCAVLCCALLCYAVLCYAVLRCAVLRCAVPLVGTPENP